MKTKSLNKKLALNKKTVANLEKKEMSTAKGGWGYTFHPDVCINTEGRMCTRRVYCEYSLDCY